jgi:hypothetical protein
MPKVPILSLSVVDPKGGLLAADFRPVNDPGLRFGADLCLLAALVHPATRP